MKRLLANLSAAFACVILLTACGTLSPDGPYAGDQTLYKADVTISTAYEVIHSFVLFEYTNRAALLTVDPKIKAAADNMRRGAPQWFGTAIALRDAYQQQPGTQTRDALQTAVLVLRTAMLEATKYMALQQKIGGEQ